MRTTAATKAVILVCAAVLGAGSGCSDRDYTYPFYDMELDTVDTDTGSDGDGDGDGDGDTDTDECDDQYVDDLGRCIRYVDWDATATVCGTSWDEAFTNIQDGIDSAYAAAAVLGDCEVWVASGTYRSYVSEVTDTIYMRSLVRVYGGFAGDETELEQRDIEENVTILDGRDELAVNASYHVVMGADEGELDGFTITGGLANGATPHHRGGGLYSNSTFTTVRNCTFRDNGAIEGGGAFLYDNTPLLERCLFEENHAERGGALFVLNGAADINDVEFLHNAASESGGAVYLKSVFGDCSPVFDNVTIDGNISQLDGGGVYIDNCHPALTESKLVGNTAVRDGGGLSGEHGAATLTGSTVQGNAAWGNGGGVHAFDTELRVADSWVIENSAAVDGGGLHMAWIDSSDEATVEATEIAANSAGGDGGGVFAEVGFPSFSNSIVTGNRAARGAGAFNGFRAVATYVNTVFHGNRAAEVAGGVYNAELSEVDLFNDIVYGDLGGEIVDEEGSDTEVAFCDVLGGNKGLHIIDEDPLFAEPGSWIDPGTPDNPSDDTWAYGDYHLQAGSPCIDQADDDASPEADADGHDWTDFADAGLPDVVSDMGAYDYQM